MRVRSFVLSAIVLVLWASVSLAADNDTFLVKGDVPLKVIVRENTAVYSTPSAGDPKITPAQMFDFYFVLKPRQGEGPKEGEFYRISKTTSAERAVGYIHQDKVVEWAHREALGFMPQGKRQLGEFFGAKEELQSAYEGKLVDVIAKEPEKLTKRPVVPLLDSFKFKHGGDQVTGYQVAYMARFPGAGDPGGSTGGRIDPKNATLDIVFVIDTTASMQPYIEATKEVVAKVARQLAADASGGVPQGADTPKLPIRFGLVAYRDVVERPDPAWYVTKTFCTLTEGQDHAAFLQKVANLKAADATSEDVPEDVLAGLTDAIKSPDWNPEAVRQIILIGDSSAQVTTKTYKNKYKTGIKEVVSLAQPAGKDSAKGTILIHACQVIDPRQAPDREAQRAHYTELAAGNGYPGAVLEFDGTPGKQEPFISEIMRQIMESRDVTIRGLKGQFKDEDKNLPGFQQIFALTKPPEGANGGEKQFRRGFVCEVDKEMKQVLEPYVLVQRRNLELFVDSTQAVVDAIDQAGEPGKRDPAKLLQNLQGLSAALSIPDFDETSSLSKIFSATLNLPVKSDILKKTPKEVAEMGPEQYKSWVDGMRQSVKLLKAAKDDAERWITLGGGEVPLEERYAFIRVTDLP
jgi:serine/threonine-protein kinase PpkA